jgi:endoglucanase
MNAPATDLREIGLAVAARPTAPGREGHVRAYVLGQLRGLAGVSVREDEFGNIIALYQKGAGRRHAFRAVAHMDHPAFVVGKHGALSFRGGVDEKCFAGRGLRFYGPDSIEPLGHAVVTETHFSGDRKIVRTDRPSPAGATFATWKLPPARCTARLFISPACDDLVQVATLITLLRRLAHARAEACVEALFTRAEEVGFHGALAALQARTPLQPMTTLSLETSSARGFAQLGAGPIVRVGDRLSVFDSCTTHWLDSAFREMQAQRPRLVYQRLLMGGGTCEGSVFHRAGFPTGALCVALANYHNMARGNMIRSEAVDLTDWQGLLDFLVFLATEAKSPQESEAAVTARFRRLAIEAAAELRH